MRRVSDRRVLAALATASEGLSAVELSRLTGLGTFRTYAALTRLSRVGKVEHRLWPVDGEDFSRTTYRRL